MHTQLNIVIAGSVFEATASEQFTYYSTYTVHLFVTINHILYVISNPIQSKPMKPL